MSRDPARERRRDVLDRLHQSVPRQSVPRQPGSDYHARQLDRQAGTDNQRVDGSKVILNALLAKIVSHIPAAIAADDEAAARWLGVPVGWYREIKDQMWQEFVEQQRRERRKRLRPPSESDTYVNPEADAPTSTYRGSPERSAGASHAGSNRLPSRAEIHATATEVA